jgi:hypothetical protein
MAALALGLLVAAPAAHAQNARFGLGGGISIPLGDFGDGANVGWQGTGAVTFAPENSALGFQIDGTYSQFGLDGPLDVNSRFIYGTGNVVYTFSTAPDTRFRPYLIGGAGIYNIGFTGDDADLAGDSSTEFGINAGAGFNFDAGGTGLFIEGRFHNVFGDGPSDAQFIPITVGVRFGGS